MWNSNATFFVKGGDTGFADREKRLFECLNAAEKEKNGREDSCLNPRSSDRYEGMEVEAPSRKRRRAETKPFRGCKESIFNEPGDPQSRFKLKDVPDHHRNPHKWIKYSLGDVSPDDMSDSCNTATGLAFLRELELRKKRLLREEMDSDGAPAVVFRRPAQASDPPRATDDVANHQESSDKAVFKSSKLVMPEYVVGRDKKKDKKIKSPLCDGKYDKSKEIKLQHLQCDDDPE